MAKQFSEMTLQEQCEWHMTNDFSSVRSIRILMEVAEKRIEDITGTLDDITRSGVPSPDIETRLQRDLKVFEQYLTWGNEKCQRLSSTE